MGALPKRRISGFRKRRRRRGLLYKLKTQAIRIKSQLKRIEKDS